MWGWLKKKREATLEELAKKRLEKRDERRSRRYAAEERIARGAMESRIRDCCPRKLFGKKMNWTFYDWGEDGRYSRLRAVSGPFEVRLEVISWRGHSSDITLIYHCPWKEDHKSVFMRHQHRQAYVLDENVATELMRAHFNCKEEHDDQRGDQGTTDE